MINIHCCYIILHCTKDPLNILKIIDCWLFMLWDTSPLKILNVSHEIHNISHEIPNILMISLLCWQIDDPVDAFAVHGAAGAWGVLAAAIFDWGSLGDPAPQPWGFANQPWGTPRAGWFQWGHPKNGWFIRGNPIQKWMMTGGIMTQETTIDDAIRCHWLNNAMELGLKDVYKDVYSTQKWFQ